MAFNLNEIASVYNERSERFIKARAARIIAHDDEAAKQQAYFDAQDFSRKADEEFTEAQAAILDIIEKWASAFDEPGRPLAAEAACEEQPTVANDTATAPTA